jgi:hypothetical protein
MAEKAQRRSRPAREAVEPLPIDDPRFAAVQSDPRFSRFPKASRLLHLQRRRLLRLYKNGVLAAELLLLLCRRKLA